MFIIYSAVGIILTTITQLADFASGPAALMMSAFVLRFVLIVMENSKEEHLMFLFVLVALFIGGELVDLDKNNWFLTLDVLSIFAGYAAAVHLARLRLLSAN